MEFNFADRIDQKGTRTLGEIEQRGSSALGQISQQKDSALSSITALGSDVKALERDVATAKDRVADLTVTAVKDLSRKKIDELNDAGTAALNAVKGARKDAVDDIKAHSDTTQLDGAVKDARASIAAAATLRIGRVSDEVVPDFRNMLERTIADDKRRLTAIEARLRDAESRGKLLGAAIRVAGVPDKGLPGIAAAAFGTTLVVIYTLAGVTLLLFALNGVLLYKVGRLRHSLVQARRGY